MGVGVGGSGRKYQTADASKAVDTDTRDAGTARGTRSARIHCANAQRTAPNAPNRHSHQVTERGGEVGLRRGTDLS
jgi:hypothetical protein